jgi:hypothetical protein
VVIVDHWSGWKIAGSNQESSTLTKLAIDVMAAYKAFRA